LQLCSALSARVPGCQKLQMTAKPDLAQYALQLYPYGNSGRQMVSLSYNSHSRCQFNVFYSVVRKGSNSQQAFT